jgi:hypothetical protein
MNGSGPREARGMRVCKAAGWNSVRPSAAIFPECNIGMFER